MSIGVHYRVYHQIRLHIRVLQKQVIQTPSAKVPALTNILKLHNPTPVIERTAGFDRLLADLAHHQRFRLPRRLGLEHGLCVRVVPHVMPPIVPRGFVAVVM